MQKKKKLLAQALNRQSYLLMIPFLGGRSNINDSMHSFHVLKHGRIYEHKFT